MMTSPPPEPGPGMALVVGGYAASTCAGTLPQSGATVVLHLPSARRHLEYLRHAQPPAP